MLGDTGSNLLGASLGFGWLQSFPETGTSLLVLLIILHVIAERWSINSIIEKNRFLRRIDGWTGKR